MTVKTSILDNPQVKIKCQRFTPESEVREMLCLAGYSADNNIYGKKVLEHSFGDGIILSAIVEEYIKSGILNKRDTIDISASLSTNVYGFELDDHLYNKTINKLDRILASYSIPKVDWNLYNEDALFWNSDVVFDYIIGNPPYVSYGEIDQRSRELLKDSYATCQKGKYDYCYAFIEFSVKHLSDEGKLVQLVPNNIYKNVFAHSLRQLLLPHISKIFLYPAQQIFKNVLTSSSIFLYDNKYNGDMLTCINMTKKRTSTVSISKEDLGEKWLLSGTKQSGKRKRFGDFYQASNTIATLCNEAFLIEDGNQEGKIEKQILRPAVSPKTFRFNKKQQIIFPYKYCGNTLERYSEEQFLKEMPLAADHLKKYTDQLESRDADKNAKWFEYGRSQAIGHMNQKKLLISTIVTNRIAVFELDEETIPYTGIYIVPNSDQYDLAKAKAILMSQDFLDYVSKIGTNTTSTSLRVTCKDINNYMFPEEIIHGRTELSN